MTIKQIYLLLCGASTLLYSCSNDSEIQVPDMEKTTYLEISVEPQSRADLLNDLPSKCEYGAYCNSQMSKVNFDNGTSTIATPIALSTSSQKVFAYYPWNEGNEDMLKKEGLLVFNALDGIDCLWGLSSKEVSVYYPKAIINFNHVFSYTEFVIKPNDYLAQELREELIVDRVFISGLPIISEVFPNGNITSPDGYGDVDLKCNGENLAGDPIKVGTLCASNSSAVKYDITIGIYFRNHTEPAMVTIKKSDWKRTAGMRYTYTITISGRLEAALSASVSVNPWVTDSSQDFVIK